MNFSIYLQDEGCVKFDFVPTTTRTKCWIHSEDGETLSSDRVDQYVKVDFCDCKYDAYIIFIKQI